MSFGQNIIGAVVIAVTAAGITGWFLTSSSNSTARIAHSYPEGIGGVVPLGHEAGQSLKLSTIPPNPFSSDPPGVQQMAVQEGKRLFSSMNCAGCHGYNAKGNMGPDLTDTAWRYGGTPIDIYKSIFEGRPKGMPAWGSALPPQTIWEIVAYIQSLGGASPALPGDRQQVVDQGTGAQKGQKQ